MVVSSRAVWLGPFLTGTAWGDPRGPPQVVTCSPTLRRVLTERGRRPTLAKTFRRILRFGHAETFRLAGAVAQAGPLRHSLGDKDVELVLSA